MLPLSSAVYKRLYDRIAVMPVIDCHEHLIGPEARPPYQEPIAALIQGYVFNDLQSAGYGIPAREIARLQDPEVPTDEKWPLFEQLWHATEHTAYARVTRLVLKQVYGEPKLTRQALERVSEKLASRDEAAYFNTIEASGIRAMLVDVLGWLPLDRFLDGKKVFPDKWRLMISLPGLHPNSFNRATIDYYGSLANKHITSLDEYLETVFVLFQRCIELGAVGLKDQSAYDRVISYELVPRAEAERLFNRVLADPRNHLGWPESKPLGDFLFHHFMRLAGDLDLPVQIHTGHMAGIYNRVDKANAVHLSGLLELHQKVRFDLFHGNWPYLGDLLFLGKNYPNVSLNCCWLHIIDPLYARQLLERAVLTLPHTKIHGFGGDYGDVPEFVAGHLQIARENIAAALADLVEDGWLEEEDAVNLAAGWLFNNPNRFFRLGMAEI
jgi:hypothetical protein